MLTQNMLSELNFAVPFFLLDKATTPHRAMILTDFIHKIKILFSL